MMLEAKGIRCLALVGVLLLSGAALAHEGHDHGGDKPLKGTVKSIADGKLSVTDVGGKAVNVHVDDRTEYDNGGVAGKAADVKVGSKVVVHGEAMKDGTIHAKKVRFGKSRAQTAPPARTAPKEGAASKQPQKGQAAGDHAKH